MLGVHKHKNKKARAGASGTRADCLPRRHCSIVWRSAASRRRPRLAGPSVVCRCCAPVKECASDALIVLALKTTARRFASKSIASMMASQISGNSRTAPLHGLAFRHRAIAARRAHSWRCCLVELSIRACAPRRPIFWKKRTVRMMLGVPRT